MDTLEKDIEIKIKNRLSHIKPSRSLFESTINKSVTSEPASRYNKEKASVSSFYKLINNLIMITKKNLLFGVPVVVVAVIAIIFIAKSPDKVQPIAMNSTPVLQEQKTTSNNNLIATKKEDLSSVDSIIASFNQDAETDAVIAAAESDDTTLLKIELQKYNNIKTYEDTL